MVEELTDLVADSTGIGYLVEGDNSYLISATGGSHGYLEGLKNLAGSYSSLDKGVFYRSLQEITGRYVVQPVNKLFPREAIYDINRRTKIYKRRGDYNDGKEERELDM